MGVGKTDLSSQTESLCPTTLLQHFSKSLFTKQLFLQQDSVLHFDASRVLLHRKITKNESVRYHCGVSSVFECPPTKTGCLMSWMAQHILLFVPFVWIKSTQNKAHTVSHTFCNTLYTSTESFM